MSYVTLTPQSLPTSHICCAISDKKCAEGYAAKRQWLADQHAHGYRFRRLDERGKAFIEYGPAESAWMPVIAPGWLTMGCFWVSGQFKGHGHGRALLNDAMQDARDQGRAGLVSLAGKKKMHFQSDGQWLLKQGFREVDTLHSGFSLLALPLNESEPAQMPQFAQSTRDGVDADAKGVTVYYSNRCPFTDYHIKVSLQETCRKRGLPLTVHKLDTLSAAQKAPTPATIFSLFLDSHFVTTDISACMDSRFDKVVGKAMAA